jgi:tRNA nucleotidyltransferase (CCA-adding enzyme)
LAQELKARLREHQKFGTAVILLPNGEKIDVATARTEYYEFPAALPTVESSSLRQDLYRRDFTINAMAVSINAESFGEMRDYFNGKEDLEKKLVRVLYNLSFIEDPTRIIRAVRFEQRYGFTMEEQTLSFAKHAIDNSLIEELSFHRIREELTLILHEIDPLPALRRLDDIGIWKRILPEVMLDKKTWDYLISIRGYLKNSPIKDQLNKAILFLSIVFMEVTEEKALTALNRFQWSKREREMVQEFLNLRKKIELMEPMWEISLADLYLQLMDFGSEALLATALLLSPENRKKVVKFCEKRIGTSLAITGKDILTAGISPGPQYSCVLRRVLAAKIAGEVSGKNKELKYAIELLRMEPKLC